MGQLETRELECFLALADELHFGRAARRLYLSQSRVSQLLAALERRVGTRLVDRTSRRVRLTPSGERFLTELRPAYERLTSVVESAREAALGRTGTLRIGFQCLVNAQMMRAITAFRTDRPGVVTTVVELPLADPFGAVRRGEVDTAVVTLPVAEPDLELGAVFSRQPQTLAVGAGHRYTTLPAVPAGELTEAGLIAPAGPAPEYWRLAQAPGHRDGPEVSTLQEGLTLVAAGLGTMLLCRPAAEYYARPGLVFVPVDGLPPTSLGVIWRRGEGTALAREFAAAVTGAVAVSGAAAVTGAAAATGAAPVPETR
ncbi:LysR family transcriptional regulator [Streptomyces sp. NPDC000594]|uniref:LysR family transcriptional regulator n=1 Tax=Streptomyces sp. NPDC000594 TaxID=3154261 RepID=UPI0033179D58